jgi:rRNA maturation RNase YbeY
MGCKILIKEEKRSSPVSLHTLETIAALTFRLTEKEPRNISLFVCNDETIRQLNKRYRGQNEPTDVLSFSMDEGMWQGITNDILGDIVISTDAARRQAEEIGESVEEEFCILFTHGLLHLLGFDHKDEESSSIMEKITFQIASEVKDRP